MCIRLAFWLGFEVLNSGIPEIGTSLPVESTKNGAFHALSLYFILMGDTAENLSTDSWRDEILLLKEVYVVSFNGELRPFARQSIATSR